MVVTDTLLIVSRRALRAAATPALRQRCLSTSSAAAAAVPDTSSASSSSLTAPPPPPPASIHAIPASTKDHSNASAGACVRQVGCTRRVFLLDPYLTQPELEGLAYRLHSLSKNQAINSILIATNEDDDDTRSVDGGYCLPTSARDAERTHIDIVDVGSPRHGDGYVWHVAGGYDPLQVYREGLHRDADGISRLLDSLQQLALAVKGDAHQTHIPVITVPHGLVQDGGYALCMGSHVMATPDTCFRITHPSRGLALDPIGLSYILPRLGTFEGAMLPCAEYSFGVGALLALTGMEADASDWVDTGLATHYMDSVSTLGTLERTLSELLPWNQQVIFKDPPKYHGHPPYSLQDEDVNASFRNVAIANTLNAFSTYHTSGRDMWSHSDKMVSGGDDPSLELDPTPWHDYRESDLVNYAATFAHIFQKEKSVVGLLQRFREIAKRKSNDKEEQEGIQVAADIVRRIHSQSPLAICLVYRLLQLGKRDGETLESCMEREKRVQAKLFGMSDFENWAKHASQFGEGKAPPFKGWKHNTVRQVTRDEVDELVAP